MYVCLVLSISAFAVWSLRIRGAVFAKQEAVILAMNALMTTTRNLVGLQTMHRNIHGQHTVRIREHSAGSLPTRTPTWLWWKEGEGGRKERKGLLSA